MLKFNIKESGKVNFFLGVYYEWGHDNKGPYTKMNMENDIIKVVDRYKKFARSDLKVQKTTGATGTTLSNSDL